jgi:hypothetical protein
MIEAKRTKKEIRFSDLKKEMFERIAQMRKIAPEQIHI